MHVFLCVCVNILLTGGHLDWLHCDDPVCACGFLHYRCLHPDGCVGQRQTPQLLEGVQRLSNPALLHTPLHPLRAWERKKQLLHTHPTPSLIKVPPSMGEVSECVCWGLQHGWILVIHASCTVILSCMSLCNKQRQLQLLWVLDWWMQDCYRQKGVLNAAKS